MRIILFSLVLFSGATFHQSEAFAKGTSEQIPTTGASIDLPMPVTSFLECSEDPKAVISQLRAQPISNKPESEMLTAHQSSLRYLNFLLQSDRLDHNSDEMIAKAIVYIEGGGLKVVADASCGQSFYLKLSNGEVLFLPLHRE